MGVVFFILLMLLFSGCGVLLALAGAGLLILSRVRTKRGGSGRALTVSAAVMLAVGLLAALPPALYFGFIFYVNATPPAGFVETAVELDGYQAEDFTAAGTDYAVLRLAPCYEGCRAAAEPVFHWRTKGLLNGSRCGNYYRLANERGFDLLWDGSFRLFYPPEQAEAVLAFYGGPERVVWSADLGGTRRALGKAASELLTEALLARADRVGAQDTVGAQDGGARSDLLFDPRDGERVHISGEVSFRTVRGTSADSLVDVEVFSVLEYKGVPYLTVGSFYDERDGYCYIGSRLPPELESALREEPAG